MRLLQHESFMVTNVAYTELYTEEVLHLKLVVDLSILSQGNDTRLLWKLLDVYNSLESKMALSCCQLTKDIFSQNTCIQRSVSTIV